MTNELENKLTEKYPNLFRGRHLSIQENLMPFGCECGDGWFKILDSMCRSLQKQLDKDKDKGSDEFMFMQIKEKYGTLRVYANGYNDAVDKIIHRACKKSHVTCEDCGKPGKYRDDGWCYTRCNSCWRAMKKADREYVKKIETEIKTKRQEEKL